MPYLFDPSKLNYSGNKVAVRNLISVCNGYEEIYSNIRAQLTLAKDSVNSWYSVWNGSFQTTSVSINPYDPEHKQFLKQLAIILDLFYNNISSILSTCSVPITMQYDYNKFTYYVPFNNNFFKNQPIALSTISNLVINVTDDVIALKNTLLNVSKVNRSLLFQYDLTASDISNDIIDSHDISGYNIYNSTLNNDFLQGCDISYSTISNSYLTSGNDLSGGNVIHSIISYSDVSDNYIVDSSLNNCNIRSNTYLYRSDISSSYAYNSTVNGLISGSFTAGISSSSVRTSALNSYFNTCSFISNINGDSLYITSVADCSNSVINNSDFVDTTVNTCMLFSDSFVSCKVTSSDISNCYISSSDISASFMQNSNVNTSQVTGGYITASIIVGNNSLNMASPDLTNSVLNNVVISDCDISGVLIYRCSVYNCNLYNCLLINNNSSTGLTSYDAQPGQYCVNYCKILYCTGSGNNITNSSLYPYLSGATLIESYPVTISSSNITYSSNFFRTLRLKYLVGRLNNIGCYNNTSLTYNFINDISDSNCLVGGRYFYKIGDFATEIISVNLQSKTIADVFYTIIGDGTGSGTNTYKTIPTPTTQWDESVIYELNNNPIVEIFSRMMDEINFSSGLLEDSRNLFNALL